MGFSKQEYWSGLSCPPSGDLLDPGIEHTSLTFPALAGRVFTTSTTWESPLFSTVAVSIYIPTNCTGGFLNSTPSPAFLICRLFNDDHFGQWGWGVWYLIVGFFLVAFKSLVSWPRMEPRPSAMEAQSPNHWTTGNFPQGSSDLICISLITSSVEHLFYVPVIDPLFFQAFP